MSKKTVNTVMLVIYLTVFSKGFGLLRDVLIGYRFGTSMESDAYFAAYRMSITLFLSVGSAITATAIPSIVKFIKTGEGLHQQTFLNRLVTHMAAVGAAVTLVGWAVAPVYARLIASGFHGEKLDLTIRMVRLFFPVILLVPLVYLMISVLQANQRFAVSSMISIPYNVVLILYLVLLSTRYGITGLAAATLIGWGGQLLLLVIFAGSARPRIRPDWTRDREVTRVFKMMGPILLSSAVYNLNILVDSAVASTLPEGQLSSMNFANIAYTAIASTLIFGISTVLFPQFSSLVAENRMDELRRRLSRAVKVMAFLFLPVLFGLIAVSGDLVRVLYLRGTFDLAGASATAGALGFYALGIVGFSVQELSNKVYYALKDTRTPFITSALTVALNIILDLIFVRFWGIRGLALATSVAVTVNALVLLNLLQKRIGRFNAKEILGHFTKVLVTAALMGAGVWAFGLIDLAAGIRLPISVLLGAGFYYIMSDRLRLPEITDVKEIWQDLRNRSKGA